MNFQLVDELKQHFPDAQHFDDIMRLQGEIYRDQPGRKTLRFEKNNQFYFAKLHFGVGWQEIFKNIISLRLPIISAQNEWIAIQELDQVQIPTTPLLGFGNRGWNPATRKSFVITRALENTISLEDYCKSWLTTPPNFSTKHNLIKKVAELASKMHLHGMNHRDFYICHIHFQQSSDEQKLYLIDLHRMQCRARVPKRWLIKDIGSLYYSIMHLGFTKRDLLRFMKYYQRLSLRETLQVDKSFWRAVVKRAEQLKNKEHLYV